MRRPGSARSAICSASNFGSRLAPIFCTCLIAVSAPQRLAVLPQVPTFAELNLTELNWSAFFGLVAPAHTPQPVVARLNAALNEALGQPAVRDLLAAQQASVTPGTPAQFSALIGREMTRMKRATLAANIRIE